MALKVPLDGCRRLLDNFTATANLRLHLFQNNYTPADGDTVANYTEANFTGYSPPILGPWTPATIAAPRAVATCTPVLFAVGPVPTVGNQVYGYYVTDVTGSLVWAERDPGAPVPMLNNGDQYRITPGFSYRSEF
jgi:hypothetical protein